MAALLRGLRVGRALRGLGSVVIPKTSSPQCNGLRRGFHCAALCLQEDKDKSIPVPPSSAASSTTTFHEHYQAHPSKNDTTTYTQEAAAKEAPQPNTRPKWRTRRRTLGLSAASSEMFQNGAGDLVLHFVAQCNAQLTEQLAEQHNKIQLGQAEPKKTAEFLRDAVETRLRMLTPYIDNWPQAMSILLLPHNIPDSLKHLSTLVDDIWYYAGDRSTDVSRPSQPKYPSPHVFLTPFHQAPHTIRPASAKLNWYTKRAALTGIYNTTELVMIQDSSEDFQDTWNFLENRIQDIVNMAGTAKQAVSTGEAVAQGLMGAAVT
ncbi:unnamed protein product, partial [Coregonus sp. 'balchen']